VAFRNLAQPGGPGYRRRRPRRSPRSTRSRTVRDDGRDVRARRPPGRLFPVAVPNEQAAECGQWRQAYPPDLSLIAKARSYERGFPWFLFDIFTQYQEQGPNYVDGASDRATSKGRRASTCRKARTTTSTSPAISIKMPKPLSDGQVTYSTTARRQTVQQYAKDVTAFLMWTAEPHLEAAQAHRLPGHAVPDRVLGPAYFTKKKVWANAH
jgi:ubiquinol-cytochrome c reductase cytochrome b/c1 subunit